MHFLKYQHSLKFRCITWLAALAIMLPTLVPFFHHAPVSASGPLGLFHICSVAFKKSEPTADDSKPVPGKPSCPICQNLHLLNSGFVPPHAVVAVPVFFSVTSTRPIPDQTATPILIAAIAWPRAPPVSFQAS